MTRGQWRELLTCLLNTHLLAWSTCISQSFRECVCDLGNVKVASRLATLNVFTLWPACLQAAQALVRMCVTCRSQMERLLIRGKGPGLSQGLPGASSSSSPRSAFPGLVDLKDPAGPAQDDAWSFLGTCWRSTKLTQQVRMNPVRCPWRKALWPAEPSSCRLQWFVFLPL